MSECFEHSRVTDSAQVNGENVTASVTRAVRELHSPAVECSGIFYG